MEATVAPPNAENQIAYQNFLENTTNVPRSKELDSVTEQGDTLLPIPTKEKKKFALSLYYSLENERKKVEELYKSDLTDRDIDDVIDADLRSSWLEFAFNTPLTTFDYVIKDKKFCNPGSNVPAETSYYKYAEQVSGIPQNKLDSLTFDQLMKTTREVPEAVGFKQIQTAFQNGTEAAFYISPPTYATNEKPAEGFGNYLMIYFFEKDGDKIHNHIVRVDEQSDYSSSKSLYAKAKALTGQANDLPENDHLNQNWFLMKPILMNQKHNINEFLQKVGISQEQLMKGLKYETVMNGDPILLEMKSMYLTKLHELKQGRYDKAGQDQLLNAMFNRTLELKTIADQHDIEHIKAEYKRAAALMPTIQADVRTNIAAWISRYDRQAMVEGGASCPTSTKSETVQKAFEMQFGNHALLNSLFGAPSLEKASESCWCGRASDGHYHCPNEKCKKTYENESDRPKDKRTTRCDCGCEFKFNC
jgi:hypothetical protein